MIKITPIEGSPDQFTATLNNLDIFALTHAIKAAETVQKLAKCNCAKCKHMLTVIEEVKRACEYVEKEQKSNLAGKLFELEFGSHGKKASPFDRYGMREIDADSEEGKKIIDALKSLGIIPDRD